MIARFMTAGRLGDFWNVLREVDPETVIREALQPVRIVVCGSPGTGKRTLASDLLAGSEGQAENVVDVYDMPDDVALALPAADLYLYVADRAPDATQRSHVQQLQRRSGILIYVVNDFVEREPDKVEALRESAAATLGLPRSRVLWSDALDRRKVAETLVPALVRAAPDLALPLGRRLPVFRPAASDYLVRETARVNAEFALLSSLPALVPVVGGLTAAGADMIILTKNQVMLMLKLAVLNRRSIDNRLQVLSEVLPVVGAGFFWRSAARTLITFLPGPLGIAPRGAVAYVGTFVAGKAGEYYYQWGRRPSPELLDRFRREAVGQLETVAPLLAGIGKRIGF